MFWNFLRNLLGKANWFPMTNIWNFRQDSKKSDGCSAAGEKGFRAKLSRKTAGEKISELREKTWLPLFHLFGFSMEFAFTFQPSPFQFTLTARSTPARSQAENHPCHRPLNALEAVSYSGHQSPPVFCTNSWFFERIFLALSRRKYPARLSRKNSWSHDAKAVAVA